MESLTATDRALLARVPKALEGCLYINGGLLIDQIVGLCRKLGIVVDTRENMLHRLSLIGHTTCRNHRLG